MSNFSSLELVSQGQTSTGPQIFCASTPDNLATIKAAGYLNDLYKMVKANDIFFINYSDTSTFPLNTGLTASAIQVQVTYSAPNWSLIESINPIDLQLTHNHLYIGGTDNSAVDAPVTGDIGFALTTGNAVSTIAANAVTTAKIADGNVTLAKLEDGIQYLYRCVGGLSPQFGTIEDVTNVFAVTPANAGDGVHVTVTATGATPGGTVVEAKVSGPGEVTVVMSGTSVGRTASILVFRPID